MNLKLLQKILQPSKTVDVFDKDSDEILEQLKLYKGEENEKTAEFLEESIVATQPNTEVIQEKKAESSKVCCTTCDVSFEDFESQREHFKLDWHRYNIKQKSIRKSSVSEDVFEEQISGEMSSISGSDSEGEDLEPSFTYKREISEEVLNEKDVSIFLRHPFKRFYVTRDSLLVSMYRSIFPEPQELDSFNGKAQVKNTCFWTYLMLSAGHFAGAVFEKKNVVAHKTFHRYTVRQGRGTAQGLHDKKGGHAKSAGATLRRYNEAALAEDIANLLTSWSGHLNKSDRIFFRCSNHQMDVLFGEKKLNKNDSRVSKISLMTKRPTLKEVKRIHQLFSAIEVHGMVSEVNKRLEEICCTESKLSGQNVVNNTLTINDDTVTDKKMASLKTNHLKIKKKKNTKGSDKDKEKERNEKPARILNELEILWHSIYQQIQNGETENVAEFLTTGTNNVEESTENEGTQTNGVDERKLRMGFLLANYLNFCSPELGETLLHIAVKQNDTEIINALLISNADPCVTNSQGQVPYDIAQTKQSRNEFRRFMAKFPNKYDYKEAKIPSPLTEDVEQERQKKLADKRKQQQKARKEKLKVKKAVEKQEKAAEKEQKAFEALSDREKRAVMAERRFASQLSTSLKCANCRAGLDAKEAFERYEYKYCSVNCVQAHKKIIGK